MQTFFSHGKLLLTGEYTVLDGALALALPTPRGQKLVVAFTDTGHLSWESHDPDGQWFKAKFQLGNYTLLADDTMSENNVANNLQHILKAAQKLNPEFLRQAKGVHVITTLEFPKNWGLGSSSTLLNNIAQWAAVNPYELLHLTYGGSGYDIACAKANSPLLFQLKSGIPQECPIDFSPPFTDSLFFIYLNKKALSGDAVLDYRKLVFDREKVVAQITEITHALSTSNQLEEWNSLLTDHEEIMSSVLQRPTIKESLFFDFPGIIKSLGAWGGDFILATGGSTTPAYFKERGFNTVIPYNEMVY